jgi:putative membrane protein
LPIGPWELAIILFILGGPLLLGALFAIFMISRARSTSKHDSDNKSAMQILDERYARGEIGSEEYEEKRRRITGRSDS